jgi:Predicted phosphohydrolase (DHH superfamily)
LNDKISQDITELGTKADTWRLEPEVQEWMDVDNAFTYFKENKAILIQALSEGNFEIKGKLKEVLEKYLQEKENAKKKLLENVVVREVKGHLVAVGYAIDPLSGSESADILLKETGSEVQIIVKPQGWMSFRRAKTSNINLIPLAKIFGGGGHEYASGGDLGKTVSQENFSEIAEEIFSKIAEVL